MVNEGSNSARNKASAQAACVETEVRTEPNLFVGFVESNRDSFSAFNSSSRELRQTRRAWQQAFVPIQQGIVEGLKYSNINTSNQRQIETAIVAYVFGKPDVSLQVEDQSIDEPTELDSDVSTMPADQLKVLAINQTLSTGNGVRKALTSSTTGKTVFNNTPEVVIQFKKEYDAATMPTLIERDEARKTLWDSTMDYMLSSYESLLDLQEVLCDTTNPTYRRVREEIAPYFGYLIAGDEEARKRGDKSVTGYIREQWQESAKSEFEPILFERFWNQASVSSETKPIVELVTFGARMSMAQRDEFKGGDITAHEIQASVARVPFEQWPASLKDAYTKFGMKDIVGVVELIRGKSKELFPQPSDRQISVVDNRGLERQPSSKKKSQISDRQASTPNTQGAENGAENGVSKPLDLAILKFNQINRGNKPSHFAERVSPEMVDQAIADFVDRGGNMTLAMRRDITGIIKVLLANPSVVYGPATSKLLGQDFSISLVKGKTMPYRRVDPRRVNFFTYEDPNTLQARITFALDGNTLALHRVFPTHSEYDAYFGSRKKSS